MTNFNITNPNSVDDAYNQGLLPQRNQKNLFYQDSSSRSVLNNLNLNSENRRIVRKTEQFTYETIPLTDFNYTPAIQKQIHQWVKELGWDFPTSSIRTVFTNHIFNYLYIWYNESHQVVAYSICYFSPTISHIAYVFYNPTYYHGDLPIRQVIQFITDSHQKNLKYAYLGRFSPTTGFYKRNMPNFEYFQNNQWLKY
jgi:hypothetical protein